MQPAGFTQETPPGVLHPALGAYKKDVDLLVGPEEHKYGQMMAAPLIWKNIQAVEIV